MDDFADRINQLNDNNFASDLGLAVVTATTERIVGTLKIEARHLQPAGIVHGGVYCSIIESLASMGALINLPQGRTCAGIENHTSFLRSIGAGTVTAVALPVNRGRSTHLWEVDVRDERERLVARGTVRLAILEVPAQA
jgi:1,4-dihydroxy-2-naphthoyl-CoA hydrolase